MSLLSHYALFALETFTFVVAFLILVAGVLSIANKPKQKIKIKSLNRIHDDVKTLMRKEILGEKKQKSKKDKVKKPSLFVIDFNGDVKASEVQQLREEISAILSIATKKDEVVVRLESPGGTVNGYGLAAAQLQRLREKSIPLTVCIDKVAASGGYLMACVAEKIIAAPFSIIGSIGVAAQLPNFYRLLKKNDIDVELLTAGEYKRTLTMFTENTKHAREKVQADIELIHERFKNYVLTNRDQLDIDKISTGEHWLAVDAFDLKLVDLLQTSDDYLNDKMQTHNSFLITIKGKQKLADKLFKPALKLFHPWA